MKVIVLGAGRVGAAMARDLARDADTAVTAADASPDALARLERATEADGSRIRVAIADLADPAALSRALDGHDLAVGAVPGPMGFETLRRVVAAGIDCVDISFFEEDALELDGEARRRGVTVVVDAGVAPGLSNLFLGHHEARMDRVDSFTCVVGGIPADPVPPWNYRAPFSPIDVIAEYTRPARLRRAGHALTLPALSEVEPIEFPGVGTLEAFNTDGLRTLLRTSRVPDLTEKTMRWPGHAQLVRALRDSGFFDERAVALAPGASVRPLDLSARLLFDAWRYRDGEEDLTAMRVVVEGEDRDGPVRHTLLLLDRHDAATGVSSMARTTGYTATSIARLVLAGRFRRPGISPPETVAAEMDALPHVTAQLRARGVDLRLSEEPID